MYILVLIVHVIVCLFLIIVVLLQSGKAADLAGAFGGMGSQTAFGPRGSATLLVEGDDDFGGAVHGDVADRFRFWRRGTRDLGTSVLESAPKTQRAARRLRRRFRPAGAAQGGRRVPLQMPPATPAASTGSGAAYAGEEVVAPTAEVAELADALA